MCDGRTNQTHATTRASFAEMESAMEGIDFNPDPSEIQIGGGDSPRILSTTESYQKSLVDTREKVKKAHREGTLASRKYTRNPHHNFSPSDVSERLLVLTT